VEGPAVRRPQLRVPHTLGFPVKLVGVDEPLAAFLDESRTRGDCLVPLTGNPGISPAFGEMWEMKLLSRASLQVIAHFRGRTR
jgi:hypothetical protein